MVGTLSTKMSHIRALKEKSMDRKKKPTPENYSLVRKNTIPVKTHSSTSTSKTVSTASSSTSPFSAGYSSNGKRTATRLRLMRESRDDVSEMREKDTSTCCELCRSLISSQSVVLRRREVLERIKNKKGKCVTFCCADPPGYDEPLSIPEERQQIINRRSLSQKRGAVIVERKAALDERGRRELRESILAERRAKFEGMCAMSRVGR